MSMLGEAVCISGEPKKAELSLNTILKSQMGAPKPKKKLSWCDGYSAKDDSTSAGSGGETTDSFSDTFVSPKSSLSLKKKTPVSRKSLPIKIEDAARNVPQQPVIKKASVLFFWNLPMVYTEEILTAELAQCGFFQEHYDLLYLPVAADGRSMGCFYISLVSDMLMKRFLTVLKQRPMSLAGENNCTQSLKVKLATLEDVVEFHTKQLHGGNSPSAQPLSPPRAPPGLSPPGLSPPQVLAPPAARTSSSQLPAAATDEKARFCPYCGDKLGQTFAFCRHCGASLCEVGRCK